MSEGVSKIMRTNQNCVCGGGGGSLFSKRTLYDNSGLSRAKTILLVVYTEYCRCNFSIW